MYYAVTTNFCISCKSYAIAKNYVGIDGAIVIFDENIKKWIVEIYSRESYVVT